MERNDVWVFIGDDEVLAEGGDGACEHERVLDLLQDREYARQPAERVERVPGEG